MQANVELELLEQLVLKTEAIAVFILLQDYLGFVGAGINAGIVWLLFRFHFVKLLSYEFFIDHYNVTSHFARSRYNTSRSFGMLFFPVGISILLYSMVTGFNTVKFIGMFGTSRSLFVFTKPNKFKVRIKP